MVWEEVEFRKTSPLSDLEISVTKKGLYFSNKVKDLFITDFVKVYIDKEKKVIGIRGCYKDDNFSRKIIRTGRTFLIRFKQDILKPNRYKFGIKEGFIFIQ